MYTEKGHTILFTLVEIAFTFHASNFLILYFSNKRFAKEFQIVSSNLKKKLFDFLKIQNGSNEPAIQLNESITAFSQNHNFYALPIRNTETRKNTVYIISD